MPPILSRIQQNYLFEASKARGLDPSEFEWSTQEKKTSGLVERITHRPTGSYFAFSYRSSGAAGLWLSWWPTDEERFGGVDSWYEARAYIDRWLQRVKQDHDAPDLWGQLAKGRMEPDPSSAALFKPFSAPELKQLEAGLDDIERYVTTTQPLDPSGEKAVRGRFAYLRDAARAGARKIDWWNIFVSQAVAMVTEGILSPTFYQPLMAHATGALAAVYKFGHRLIGP